MSTTVGDCGQTACRSRNKGVAGRRGFSAVALAVLLAGGASAQTASTLTQPGDEVLLRTSARGVQIYECRAVAGASPAWVFQEPRADLFVGEHQVGKHFAGPTWEHSDGSRIVGKVMANLPAPDPGAIPWLRLSVVSRAGSGALSAVTAVQRINTVGGVLAGACADVGDRSEVPYSADYIMLRENS